jgi:hypothetical protein
MRQTNKSAFALGQIVPTPGALGAIQKGGRAPGEFLAGHVNRDWAICPMTTAKKTNTA